MSIESLLEDVRHGRKTAVEVHDEIDRLAREYATAKPVPKNGAEVYALVDDFPGQDGPNDPGLIDDYAALGWISKDDADLLWHPRPAAEILGSRKVWPD